MPRSLPNGYQLVNDPVRLPGLEPEYHDVVCIGAGLSGVSMACKLKTNLNVTDIVILERLSGPSGTWEANTYPGCACDIPVPLYSFSFRQKTDWSGLFPQQPELREYVVMVIEEYGLGDKIRYNTVALESRYDNSTGLWHVVSSTYDPKDASKPAQLNYYVCKLFVTAYGGLSEPNPCTIPGHETFTGPIFHSGRWDHSVDTAGKNVIVVGNGCSASQFVPIVAEEAKHLTQFVRSKHWYAPLPESLPEPFPGWTWLVKHTKFFMWLQRFLIWVTLESHFLMTMYTKRGNEMRNNWEKLCREYVYRAAPKKYHEQLIPKEGELMVGCRRRVLDKTYLPSLHRENLDLETSPLVRIEANAVVTADGRRIPADVIIMANGFSPSAAGAPLRIRGRDMTMREHFEKYGDGAPVAYRTSFLGGFPNMGILLGPNAATGHMSIIFTTEREEELILSVAQDVLNSPKPSSLAISHLPGTPAGPEVHKIPTFEVKLKAELDEQHWIVKKMKTLTFSTCDSWYRDSKSGRVTAVYPDWQWKFLLRCWFPVWNDFTFTGLRQGAKHPRSTVWQKIGCVLGLGTVPYVDPSETPEIDRKSMGA